MAVDRFVGSRKSSRYLVSAPRSWCNHPWVQSARNDNNPIPRNVSMSMTRLIGGSALVLCGLLVAEATAEDRPADKILAEINAVKMPQIDQKDRGDQQAMRDFASR